MRKLWEKTRGRERYCCARLGGVRTNEDIEMD